MDEEQKDIYSDKGREELVEDGEIEPWEEGFMKGAEGEGEEYKCEKCEKILTDKDDIVEKEVNGTVFRFCSANCAEEFEEE